MDWILLLVLLTASAFFSGSETAFFSLRQPELAKLDGRGDSAGRMVVALVAQAHVLLSALLIGNLLVNTATSVVATSICLAAFGENGLAVAVPAVTVVLLVGGEITPKMLALRFRVPLALAVRRPLTVWLWVTRPLLRIIAAGTRTLLKLLPWERSGTRPLTVAELETACDLAVQDGTLSQTEGRFLARLLRLQRLEAREVMTPRPEVVFLETDWAQERVLETVRRAGFTRYPVIEPDRGQPIGLFHLKDMLTRQHEPRPLRGELRPLIFVPESKDVASLLTEMRSGHTHLVAVVDEHGDFTGIVTMADCLQALIGPAGDTSGGVSLEVFPIDQGSWVVSGRLDLRELREACGVTLPPSRDYVTIAGYIMARFGYIPRLGEQLIADGVRFTVLEMEGHKIVRIQLDLLTDKLSRGPAFSASSAALAPLIPWDIVSAVVVLCVAGSGFFSGCETGLMSVSRVRLSHATTGRTDRRVAQLKRLLHHLEDPLLTCLIGTNLCNVFASAVLTVALTARYGERGEWLAVLIMSIVIILFGEILPKVLYREFPERLTLASARQIQLSMMILAPVRWLLRAYSRLWRRILPDTPGGSVSHLDRHGVSALLLTQARPDNQDLQFRQSVRRFLELAHLNLSHIMRPAAEMVTVASTATVAECLRLAARSGFSRLPVEGGGPAEIAGWILVKDLLFLQEVEQVASSLPAALVRSPLLVDVAMSPHELFEELHAQGEQLAVVVGRQGHTLGLVTLEDLSEAVVGSIQDEFDAPSWQEEVAGAALPPRTRRPKINPPPGSEAKRGS